MTPRRRYSFWIDEEQLERLRAIYARDGVRESEQIRRALDDWLKRKNAPEVMASGKKRNPKKPTK